MQVHQRGNQSVSSGNSYSLDRWDVATVGGSAAYDLQQATDVPTGQGFAKSFKLDVTTADAAMGAGDGYIFRQAFEGQNLQSIKKGTSNAEQVTVQFWIKSTKTGTYILEMYDIDNTRQVSKSYTVSAADTWEYKTITFPADTSGTLDDDNARSLLLQWWLAAGSNYTSGTLNTTWSSVTTANRVVGQVNALDSTSNNFLITGVQLELGEQATPFEHRSYGDELTKCMRYYQQVGGASNTLALGQCSTTTQAQFFYPLPHPVRADATVSVSDATYFRVFNAAISGIPQVTSMTFSSTGSATNNGFRINANVASGLSAGNASHLYGNDASGNVGIIKIDAEL